MSAMTRNPNGSATAGPSLTDIDAITVSPTELATALAGIGGAELGEYRVFHNQAPTDGTWTVVDSSAPSILGFTGGARIGTCSTRKSNAGYSTGGAFVFGEWNGWTYYGWNFYSGYTTSMIQRINESGDTVESLLENPTTAFMDDGCNIAVGGIVGDYLYAFGGRPTSTTCSNVSRRKSLTTDAWETLGNMPAAAGRQGAVTVGTSIYLFYGTQGSSYYNTLVKFDTTNGSFTTFALPVLNWLEPRCVLLSDNKIMVAPKWSLDSYIVWDATTDTLSTAHTSINDGIGASYGVLFRFQGDAVVTMIKNKNGSKFNGTVVSFNPATGVFTDTNQSVDVFDGWNMGYIPASRSIFQPASNAAGTVKQERLYFDYANPGRKVLAYKSQV